MAVSTRTEIYRYKKNNYVYTTDDVMRGLPCIKEGVGKIYPLRVKDYMEFIKNHYLRYFIYSKKHLKEQFKLNDEMWGKTYFDKVLNFSILNKMNQNEKENIKKTTVEMQVEALEEIRKALSLIMRRDLKFDGVGCFFYTEDKEVIINKKNFDWVRKIMLPQNLIKEPPFEPDALLAEKYEGARERERKNEINFSEMVAYVKNFGKVNSYKHILNEPVFNLYCDYQCINQEQFHRTIMNSLLVAPRKMDDKSMRVCVPFIEEMLKKDEGYNKYIKDFNSLGL